MNNLTYLCTCSKQDPNEKLKEITEIGFSMSDDLYSHLINAIGGYEANEEEAAFTKKLRKLEMFKYLGREDIRELFRNDTAVGKTYQGEMVITKGWIRKKAQRVWALLDLKDPIPALAPEEQVLFSGLVTLHYHDVDGVFVPKRMEGHGRAAICSNEQRRCSCGRVLGAVTGTAEEIIVVMQGSTRAGKTTITVATNYCLNAGEQAVNAGVSIFPLSTGEGDKTHDTLKKQIELYKRGEKVEKTEKESAMDERIVSVKLSVNGKNYVLTFADMPGEIFNGEGDVPWDGSWFNNYKTIYRNCSAIWTAIPFQTMSQKFDMDQNKLLLLVEWFRAKDEAGQKLAEERINEKLREAAQKDQNAGQPQSISIEKLVALDVAKLEPQVLWSCLKQYEPLYRMVIEDELGETQQTNEQSTREEYLRRIEQIHERFSKTQTVPAAAGTGKLRQMPPHAVILTKTDGIQGLFMDEKSARKLDEMYIFRSKDDAVLLPLPGEEENKVALDEEALNRIGRNVRGFFDSYDPNMRGTFDMISPGETCYFALSSCGGAVREQGQQSNPFWKPAPYNVALPLLWTLAVNGKLPVSYVETALTKRKFPRNLIKGSGVDVSSRRVYKLYQRGGNPRQTNLFINDKCYRLHEHRQ